VVEIKNVSKSFQSQPVLTSISLKIEDGETHALLGSSGAGKSTLLRILVGLVNADSGEIRINRNLIGEKDSRFWSRLIGYVPQEGGLFPHMSAGRNVSLVARLDGWSNRKIAERMSELAGVVSLDPALLERAPWALSGGQRQRVSIMRAAFLNPPVLLLDEPLGALDPVVRKDLQAELKSIFLRLNKTVVLVTHDIAEAQFLAQRMTIMHSGQLQQTGTLKEIIDSPRNEFVKEFIGAQRTVNFT
jgi:osmoprotectant transport system ATP-binding protein